MIRVTIIIFLFAAVVAGAATQGVPKYTSDATVHLTTEDSPLPMCGDLPRSTSLEVEHRACIMPAADVVSAAAATSAAQNVTILANGDVVCTRNVIAPGQADAVQLCGGLPNTSVLVSPGPSTSQCLCLSWSQGSAEFRVCNCDRCSSIVYPNPQFDCQSIKNSCVVNGVGGYRSWRDPNSFTVLHLAHSIPPTPVPIGCNGP